MIDKILGPKHERLASKRLNILLAFQNAFKDLDALFSSMEEEKSCAQTKINEATLKIAEHQDTQSKLSQEQAKITKTRAKLAEILGE